MHILYFHQHFTTPAGAGGTRSYEMARRAIALGHSVTVVCGSYDGGYTGLEQPFKRGSRSGLVEGIRVIEFNLRYSNLDGFSKRILVFLKFAIASLRISLTLSYDVVFATTTPLTAGIPGICAKWLRRKPFVFEVRDLWPELPREMGVITNPMVLCAMSALEWISYRSANRCIALSPGIKAGIVRRGVREDRIEMVPNGCDLELFDVGKADYWRPKGVAETDFLAVFTGTHGQANGVDSILDAAVILKQRNVGGIKLVLVGNGKLKRELLLRKEAERLDNVIFHDQVSKYKISGLLSSADIGIQCLANFPAFYYGTSPNKFFDYIAAGLPVLNNYPGWLSQLIIDNDCGYVVKNDDPEAFANALELAAHDRQAMARKGHAALKLAQDSFDRKKLSACWVDWVIGASITNL